MKRTMREGEMTVDVMTSTRPAGSVVIAIDGEGFCMSWDMAARVANALLESSKQARYEESA